MLSKDEIRNAEEAKCKAEVFGISYFVSDVCLAFRT